MNIAIIGKGNVGSALEAGRGPDGRVYGLNEQR